MQNMALVRKIVSTPKAAKPVAPYNQAIVVDRTVYTSGILGLDPETNKLVPGGTVAEARQAFQSLQAILEAAGSSLENVVKTNILVNNIDEFGAVNDIYKEFFKKDYPARICYQAARLPLGANIEIEALALTGKVKTETIIDSLAKNVFRNFTRDFPARICYQAGKLPLGANIEIEAIALTGRCTTQVIHGDDPMHVKDGCAPGCKK